MLRITVPSSGPAQLTFQKFEAQDLPTPPNGIDAEINNDLVLLFEDEEEAVTYASQLQDLVNDMDDESQQRQSINEIIEAVYDNEFIRSYLE